MDVSTVGQFALLSSNISFDILGLPLNGILNEIFSTTQIQHLPVGLMQDSTLHTQSKPSVPLRRSSWFLPNETGTGAHLPLTHLLPTKATFWGRMWHLYQTELSHGRWCVSWLLWCQKWLLLTNNTTSQDWTG